MNVFEAVKQNLTTRQAAEKHGIQVSRHGMAVCPFHNDKNPSMKVDKRFHCFACQALQYTLVVGRIQPKLFSVCKRAAYYHPHR